ncbi:unnamed protein product [Adineta steineri]|uniref:Uncharacterized protein n=1 Tax=Adineta steineri TaxID=433720 RepID=A0A813XP54_9BILA|nr:unnamed protein product [Adineta steineri]CAF0869735.1 unnamed protein product [Adineta steineri]CAF1015136.1 unnamed protein product [Adineta steineri]
MLLLFVALIANTHQSSDICVLSDNHPGTRCYESDHINYTCCLHTDHCQDGKCSPLGITAPSKLLSTADFIFIGIGAAFCGVLCLTIAAIHYHRRQITNTQKRPNSFASFSTPFNVSPRAMSSAGVRIHSSINMELTTINI